MTVDALSSELRALLRERADAELTVDTFPRLVSLLSGEESRTPRIVDVQPLLDAAIATIPDDVARRSLEALLGSGRLRYQSVKERATIAARNTGVSYDAYRRKDTGRMSTDLVLLAQALTTAAASPIDSSPTRDPLVSNPTGEPSAPAIELPDTTSLDTTSLDTTSLDTTPPDTTPPSEPPNAAPPHRPFQRLALLGALLTVAVVAAGTLAIVGRNNAAGSECFAAGETDRSDAPGVAAATAIADIATDAPADSCGVERVTKRGDIYWQQFHESDRLIGGFIAFERDGELDALFLNLGQWQSFIRVGGGDGSRSSKAAGVPTGRVVPLGARVSLEVTGDALLTAEDPNGTYYWMPKVAAEAWVADGGGSGSLGYPASSVYIVDGAFRVDFERGYLIQLMEGRLDRVLVDDVGADLPPVDELRGRLISASDGTGWHVDDDGARWWIPDGDRWNCNGGTDQMVVSGLPGYAVHTLPYGGVADCPPDAAVDTTPTTSS